MTEIKDTLAVPREPRASRRVSEPFWNGTREKRILLQYDTRAGQYQFFPRATSVYTGYRSALEWREVSGEGEVFSYTVARRGREPFHGHEPFFIALVTLDVGVNVMGNVVHCPFDVMRIGLRMKPFWHPLADGSHMLMFQPG